MKKLHKEIILGAIVLLLGIFTWWFIKYIFYIGNLTLGCWISGIILLILWGIALCLAMLLIKDKRILYGSFILILVVFGLFFNNEPFYYLIVLVLCFLAFWLASKKIKKEETIEVNLNYWRIWKRGLPVLITGLILIIAMVYYFSPNLIEMRRVEIRLPRDVFNFIVTPLEGLIGERLSGGSLKTDARNFLSQEQIIELKEKYGITIKPGDTGRDVLYELVNFQIDNAGGPYKKFIPLGLAVTLFIGLKIISMIYVAIVIMLSWLVLKLLIATKFVKREIVKKEVETVKL